MSRDERRKKDAAEQRERQVHLHLRIDTYGDAEQAHATAKRAVDILKVKGMRVAHYRTEGNPR